MKSKEEIKKEVLELFKAKIQVEIIGGNDVDKTIEDLYDIAFLAGESRAFSGVTNYLKR